MNSNYDDLPEDLDLNSEFIRVFDLIEDSREHFFITGDAGTGKSTLLKYFSKYTKKNIVVLAPTGVAAINVRGQTIHSFFQLPLGLVKKEDVRKTKKKKIFENLDAVVIDEVSMVRADIMDGIDQALKINRGNTKPFGGVQVIMFGDLAQLPPVVEGGGLSQYFKDKYGTHYFFSAQAFEEVKVKYLPLTTVYRQKDDIFISLLNKVKSKDLLDRELAILNSRVGHKHPPGKNVITLSTTNRIAEEINQVHLDSLPGNEHIYEAEIDGTFNEREYPTCEVLRLKVGAQVMLLRNDVKKRRWVNGTIAKIAKLSAFTITVEIDGELYDIDPESWEKIKYTYNKKKNKIEEKIVGAFDQYPIKLAWAITIHKSQGKTFKSATIDFGYRAFTHGQVYVALSRCVSLEEISLTRAIRHNDIIFDETINGYKDKFIGVLV